MSFDRAQGFYNPFPDMFFPLSSCSLQYFVMAWKESVCVAQHGNIKENSEKPKPH